MTDQVKVAVAQAAARPFDREGMVEKVLEMSHEAAAEGARLILFPEAYVGGYPWGLAFGTAVGGRSDAGRRVWERYWDQAIEVPGPETERFAEAAREAGAYLCVGAIERDSRYSRGTLFCSLLYFGPEGTLLGKHRKLKPTAAERLIRSRNIPLPRPRGRNSFISRPEISWGGVQEACRVSACPLILQMCL